MSCERTAGGRWSNQEHHKFLQGLNKFGKNWKKIEELIETRSSTQIRSHAQKYFIRQRKFQAQEDLSNQQEADSNSKTHQETNTCLNERLDLGHNQYSFFMGQILQAMNQSRKGSETLNFWQTFIDVEDSPIQDLSRQFPGNVGNGSWQGEKTSSSRKKFVKYDPIRIYCPQISERIQF